MSETPPRPPTRTSSVAAALSSPPNKPSPPTTPTVSGGTPTAGRAKAKSPQGKKAPPRKEDEAAKRGEKVMPGSSLTDNEIIARLDPRLYEEEFDAMAFVLEKLPKGENEQLTDEYFMKEITDKDRAHDIINSRLSTKVLSNYTNFVQGMAQIQQLGDDLKMTAVLCSKGRRSLASAKTTAIAGSLAVVTKNRRVKLYRQLVEYLEDIKKIQFVGDELKATIEKGDYVNAAKMLLDCNTTVQKLQPLHCFAGLNKSLTESYVMVHNKLDLLLLDSVRNFKEQNYERLLDAYSLLGKIYQVKEMLQRYFFESVGTNSLSIVLSHVLASEKNSSRPEVFKKMSFKQLCTALPPEHLLSSLLHILESFCELLYSNHLMIEWHRAAKLDGVQEICTALENFKPSLWDEMQQGVSNMISSANMASLKIEKFLKVLHSVTQFIDIGDEICGRSSDILRTSIKQTSIAYFRHTHKRKMDDLKAMLENEIWQSIPVNPGYGIMDTKELRYFIHRLSRESTPNDETKTEKSKASYLHQFKTTGNPFTQKAQRYDKQDIDDEDLADFLEDGKSTNNANDSTEQLAQTNSKETPVLTSVSINLLRFIGEYLNTMLVLQPIALEVFVSLTQIFEYFMYSVYAFFGMNFTASGGAANDYSATLNPRLKASLLRMVEHLFKPINEGTGSPPNATAHADGKILGTVVFQPAKASFMLDLASASTMYGLAERCNAVESLMFIVEAMRAIKDPLEKLFDGNELRQVSQFYSSSVEMSEDLRALIYTNISMMLINLDPVPVMIANVKWDIKEIGMEHSPYVDLLSKELTGLSAKLTSLQSQYFLPDASVRALMRFTIIRVMEQIVEGFSRVKKCSNEGRALMSLDLQILVMSFEKLTDIRPIPHYQFAENYVKAFYLGEKEMHAWIKQHSEYSPRQLSGLVGAKSGNTGAFSSQSQKNLLKAVEEVFTTRRIQTEMQNYTNS